MQKEATNLSSLNACRKAFSVNLCTTDHCLSMELKSNNFNAYESLKPNERHGPLPPPMDSLPIETVPFPDSVYIVNAIGLTIFTCSSLVSLVACLWWIQIGMQFFVWRWCENLIKHFIRKGTIVIARLSVPNVNKSHRPIVGIQVVVQCLIVGIFGLTNDEWLEQMVLISVEISHQYLVLESLSPKLSVAESYHLTQCKTTQQCPIRVNEITSIIDTSLTPSLEPENLVL